MYENIIDTIGFVQQADPEVGDAMAKELARQKRNLEAARTLISLRPLLSKEPRSFSEQSMQTFRLIRAHRQIQLFMWLSLHPVIL